jgi:kynurenine formamidase
MWRHEKKTHYENLGLTEVVGMRFTFVGFPLKVVEVHGGPNGAVAIVES